MALKLCMLLSKHECYYYEQVKITLTSKFCISFTKAPSYK